METCESTADMQESQVDVITTLITDGQPPIAVQPGESALNHPSVPPQLLATLYPLTCYAALDPSVAKRPSTPAIVIRLVTMHLVRTLAWASRLASRAFDRLDTVHHLLEYHTVRDVSTSQFHRQWYAFALDH